MKLRHPELVDALLIASFVFCIAGTVALISGRWRAVARLDSGAPGVRAWTTSMTLGVGAAAIGAVLLIIFIASALTMPAATSV